MSNNTDAMSDNPLKLDAVTPPRLLDQLRERIRLKHYSIRTEHSYVQWVRRYIIFHGKRHPAEMGKPELEAFLTSLAVERNVSASTQTQALSALLFLYKEVLGLDFPWLTEVTRAKRPRGLPSVLTVDEVRRLMHSVDDPLMDLVVRLLRIKGARFELFPFSLYYGIRKMHPQDLAASRNKL